MHPSGSRSRLALIAAAFASAAAFGAHVAPANAAVVAGTTNGINAASLTFDDAADNVVISETVVNVSTVLSHGLTGGGLNSATDWVPGNGAVDDTVPAAGATVTVNLGGGNDNGSVTAPSIAKAILNGGDGDDLLNGSPLADEVNGGPGDDRLVGARSGPAALDSVKGGGGNDTLVWNQGDGTDDMDGEDGSDGVEVNGNPANTDTFTLKPGVGGVSDVRFDRVATGPFGLNITAAERLVINAGGGNDAFTAEPGIAGRIAVTLNGGEGQDNLSGTDGRDFINGGENVDTLTGGAGDDRIAGDRANDVMKGSAGDDTLVWSNGDGTDDMDGDEGFDVIEVNGGATEVFTIKPDGAGARFDRTDVGLFGLNVKSSELLALNALGGDDRFTVADGTPLAIVADGGAGSDTLVGSSGWESFRGGSGNDSLTGNGGLDVLDGQDGDDTILARDSAADVAACGLGADTVTADAATLDQVAPDCENVSRPAVVPPPKKYAAADISTRRSKVRNRRVAIRVTCPAAATAGCKGRLVLSAVVRVGGVRAILPIGSARYSLSARRFRTLSVRVPANLQRFAVRRRVTLTATTETRGADGALLRRSRSVAASY